MQIFYTDFPFPHIIVDDMYDESELKLIWKELDFLQAADNFKDPFISGGAKTKDGKIMKNNHGISLDQHYFERNSSIILKVNRKLWHDDILNEAKKHWALKTIYKSNLDTSLLSYYKNGDYYDPHIDAACNTAITWFYKEPKRFDGGDLIFTDFTYSVEVKNNRVVIFPSSVKHQVKEIAMDDEEYPEHGRWAMSQFMLWRMSE